MVKQAKAASPAGRPAALKIPSLANARSFYEDDFTRTLFPLKTNLFLVQNGEAEIREYVKRCLDENNLSYHFYSQKRVYASKSMLHLRRTVKLDVVSEFYLYDVVFQNRAKFRKPHTAGRDHYGYRFESGHPIAPTAAYKAFKGALSQYSKEYKFSLAFDIASYFNNLYHHDIVSRFADIGCDEDDILGLGQLLCEINSGRSIDCLPQGLYPSKMVGNDLLCFVDNYHGLKCAKLVRFMDDFHLFSDSEQDLNNDFVLIQKLLGDKGLSVNPKKTVRNALNPVELESKIDAAKRKLLKRRRQLVLEGYDENDDIVFSEVQRKFPLNPAELQLLHSLLDQPEIEEDDAELILTIMRDQVAKVEKRVPYFIEHFPNLAKSVYLFCQRGVDYEQIAAYICDFLKANTQVMEYQLFWLAVMIEDQLIKTSRAGELINLVFNHPSSTAITKAKVLEIGDHRFGLTELRHEFLTNGQSDWLAWSAAVGSRTLHKTSRNHRLSYFGKVSNMNNLIATIVLRV